MPRLEEVPERFSFPKGEEEILEYWKQNDTFHESVRLSEGRPPFSFYDGPPFATGLPHYGHILAGTIKDVVCRYAHQTGHHVPRRFGWDCHGLPVEFEIDKKLDVKGRQDVLDMGIATYNDECRAIVGRYTKEWEVTVGRVGRWIDFSTGYRTMDLSYMETVWWVFQQLHEKGYVYRGFKVMPYSCALNTPLSNFEVQQNYKDVSDPAVVVTFPLLGEEGASFLAWTTTPWTLPSNLALCVNPELEYVRIREEATGAVYILLATRLVQLYSELANPKKAADARKKFSEVERMKGSALAGVEYAPPFGYFEARRASGAFRVITGGFVTDDSGTGIVHCAPAFGEEDYKACLEHGVIRRGEPLVCPVDADGRFSDEVPEWRGLGVKEADKHIIAHLKAQGRIIKVDVINHSYPFCWRSDTPLIYRAVPGTFVAVEAIKEKLIANNKQTYWVPGHVREKRFQNWLENARDWAVSRNRFWGTPIPMWVSDDGEEIVVVGSKEELERLSGVAVSDLHREFLDHIELPSQQGKGTLKRVDEVFDCWFESGSMPYAQQHYPFENKQTFEASFPADFIAEGIDQTRGWFYTLMVLSTALFDKPAFKNLICNGLVLAADGQKMSKRKKNYPDPVLVIDSYGADALRLYLINSPVVHAEDLCFREAGVMQNLKSIFLPWRAPRPPAAPARRERNAHALRPRAGTTPTGCWSRRRAEMEAYRLYTVVPRLVELIDQLTNWYIRMNKDRFSGERGAGERRTSLCTLFEVLMMLCRMMAPLTPFFAEHVYQNLRRVVPDAPASVHFLMIPEVNEAAIDPQMEADVRLMLQVIEKGRTLRERRALSTRTPNKAHTLSTRTPLPEVTFVSADAVALRAVETLHEYIADELNVRRVQTAPLAEMGGRVVLKCMPNHKRLGDRFGKAYKGIQGKIRALDTDALAAFLREGSLTLEGETFDKEDILVQLQYSGDKSHDADGVAGGLVILNVSPDAAMLDEAMAREVCAKVQKMRKEAGLRKEDALEVAYSCPADSSLLARVLRDQSAYIAGRIGRTPIPGAARPRRAVSLLRDEEEVRVKVLVDGKVQQKTEPLVLELLAGCPILGSKAAEALPDPSLLDDVENYVHCLDYARLRGTLEREGVLKVGLNGHAFELKRGEHLFLSYSEAAAVGGV
ncbi:hypothetical protein EMIHUDRAFT_427789 [Emiliania huxleyi CCMP1516]|uniref:isoleucine--tRNA ligase n=2 Tax=Emiliania huxleyi TaxID=2903 RepID=A0A0D3IQL1_EMIH1|nr:hypothetical protein EMIHUDRAFT_427789 [Emiliania huxleyi CCMP1516]EOD13546.1 hypothetical protein EMIHUDRAFT_427789 [Emiliania huxleyi CCMP1516]|eukprot:XP_005765975.1 hypothetical protein EMIHUDRAFT_427789 [Emiliania huxleyi CCMP1516]